ncbi:MAG: ATP-binding cassette domain-containing protein [Rubrivivax sp.]|nr:ATP-binding cassette domain-containing protein [Rubrivivax sp.]
MHTWDVALSQRLQQGSSRFELDVRFSCSERRVVLFGPSGAGKTQTLRLMAGTVQPAAGRVCVAGRLLLDTAQGLSLSPQQRRLATMFQDYALFPHLTVRQNIAFGRHTGWRNPGRQATDPEVEAWIERFQLQAVAGHQPHQLSGGQRQRTALARALVNKPTALLLDEPFAALDQRLRRQLRDELLELQASLDIPLLLITHDEDDVRCIAERVVHLHGGRVVPAPVDP